MGVDICYFMDHDFEITTIENFLSDFCKRANISISKEKITELINQNISPSDYPFENTLELSFSLDKYSFYFVLDSNKNFLKDYGIKINYIDDVADLSFEVFKGNIFLHDMKTNGNDEIDFLRWNHLVHYFDTDTDFSKKWTEKLFSLLKTYLVPIFHSTKVLLTADSSSYRHETLIDFFIEGFSIEFILNLNESLFNPLCKVFRNQKCFGNKRKDYYDGEIGPLYLFDIV